MSTSNKGFMRLVIFLTTFFFILISVFSSEQVFFTVFKVVIFTIIVGVIFVSITLVKIISAVKKYFDIQQEAEQNYERFFNNFYSEEARFKHQQAKQAQDEYRKYNDRNKNRIIRNSSNLNKALTLFGYEELSEVNKDELKKKYRALIKISHPDNGGSASHTQLINESYKLLLNILQS